MNKITVRKVVQLLFWAMLLLLIGPNFDLEFGSVTYTLETGMVISGILILIATNKCRKDYKYMNRLFFAAIALISCSLLAPALVILVSSDTMATLNYVTELGGSASTMNNEEIVEFLHTLGGLSTPLTISTLIGVVLGSLPMAVCIYYTGKGLHEISMANKIEAANDLGKIKKLSHQSGLFYIIGMALAVPLVAVVFSMFTNFDIVQGEILLNEGQFTISIILVLILAHVFIAMLIVHLVMHIKLLVQIQRMNNANNCRLENVVDVTDEPLE